jgi:hypothetical protein
MPKIYSYRKTTDEFTTYTAQGEGITELCTIDGITYISVPDDGRLSADQPEPVQLQTPVLTDVLKEQIKTASPLCQLIYTRMQAQIREKYCSEDEMYLTRISVGALSGAYTMLPHEPALIAEYGAYIESIRQWGRNERANLGL